MIVVSLDLSLWLLDCLDHLQARQAGDNAMKQMQIIVRSQQLHRSPSVILRCWLFLAMSAMQQGRLKDSRNILQTVYQVSKVDLVERDVKIENMCLGIWSRLKYAWQVNKKCSIDGHS